MTAEGVLALAVQVAAGLSLAACCGLRAFVPPFVLGLAVRIGLAERLLGHPLRLNDDFAWLAGTPALVVFGVATAAELIADKVPAVDHALDVVQTVVRPLAGALVVAASLHGLGPLPAAVVGLLTGGTTALGIHAVKAQVRIGSSIATLGLASPVLSLVEDVVAVVGSLVAVTAALVALAALAAAAIALLSIRRAAKRSR